MHLFLGTDDGLAVFESRKEEWRPRYLRLQNRRVTALAVTKNTLWVGTTNGLWRSQTGGASLSPVGRGLSASHVRALAVDPTSLGTVLVGTEPAEILITRDSGETWTEARNVARLREEHGWSLPYSPAAGCVRSFALISYRYYAAVEVGGVLRSDDGGISWTLLADSVDSDVHELAVRPGQPDTVYAATGGGRYRSLNGGQDWELIGAGYTRAVWTDPERPGVMLAGPSRYVGAMGRVERTINGGDTWMLASDGFQVPMSDMIERFVTVGAYVLALTTGGEIYSAKRGVWMWVPVDLGLPPVRAAAFWAT